MSQKESQKEDSQKAALTDSKQTQTRPTIISWQGDRHRDVKSQLQAHLQAHESQARELRNELRAHELQIQELQSLLRAPLRAEELEDQLRAQMQARLKDQELQAQWRAELQDRLQAQDLESQESQTQLRAQLQATSGVASQSVSSSEGAVSLEDSQDAQEK